MKLVIKNMVSLRCKTVVKSVLLELGIQIPIVELGEVETNNNLSQKKTSLLRAALLGHGFELMEDKKSILIEMIHYSDEIPLL